jgi:biotin transport system substrate-specific component
MAEDPFRQSRGIRASALAVTGTHAALIREVLAIGLFVAFCAVAAQVSLRIPGTPVPFTLQVLAVLLGALALGPRRAFAAQVAYLVLGLAGLPVFALGRSGPAVLLGPTGGYLYGFALAAAVTGWLAGDGRSVLRRFGACVAGVVIIWVAGAVHLGALVALTGRGTNPWTVAWLQGVAPFIVVDMIKAVIATILGPGGRWLVARFLGEQLS